MIQERYMVIDAHCHIYPPLIASKAVNSTDTFYGLHSVHKGTVEDLLEMGDKAGIDRFVVQTVATNPRQVPRINEFIAEAVASHPDRLIGLGALHPDSPDMAGDVHHLRSLGLRGVKLHPDIQQFKIDDYRCLKIYELCEQEGLPILMHTGDHRYDYSNPNRLLPVMEIYTGLTVVGAHLAGWSVWEEACQRLGALPNLYVDTCSCSAFMPCEKMAAIIRHYGPSRVMFGTDYPMWPAEPELATLLDMGFTEEEHRLMLADNARRIFGIK